MLELLLLFENTKVTNLTEKRVEENKTKYLSGQNLKYNWLISGGFLWFLRRISLVYYGLELRKTLTWNRFWKIMLDKNVWDRKNDVTVQIHKKSRFLDKIEVTSKVDGLESRWNVQENGTGTKVNGRAWDFWNVLF